MDLAQPRNVIEASALPSEQIEAYDRRHFPAARRKFLQAWIRRPGGSALAVVDGDEVYGYAVMRPCRTGYKIGPLFAAKC